MIEPWAKRAFAWAFIAAVVHSAAWAGYVYYLQRLWYDNLEQRQGIIETMTFSRTGPSGQLTKMRNLWLTVRPLGATRAQPQELSSDAPMELISSYFQRHRAGDVVPIWVHRKSGRIVDVLLPPPPDLVQLFLILLATLGLVTALIIVGILGHAADRGTLPGKRYEPS